MALVSLDGLDEKTLTNISTAASGGRRPFPCDGNSYTRHTAKVVKAGLMVWPDGRESIKISVENNGHGGDLLIDLECSTAKNPQKALETRNKAIKLLGAHTSGKLDTTKLEKASGQLVALSAKHKGFKPGKNGGMFHDVALYFDGEASELLPVTQVATMPQLPGQAAGAPIDNNDDIPF